ncbi:MAG: hypothetical protein Q7S33_05165 [Nanoarchaeota archaeon]|nr:hypothetical protein [Nanoarchaeota archaeon]
MVGPKNTSTSYFTSSPALLNTTLTPNNRWFQYKAFLSTGNTSLTPTLNNVTINYAGAPMTVALNPVTNNSVNFANATFNCSINAGTLELQYNLTNVSLYHNINGVWGLVANQSISGASNITTWNYNLFNSIKNNSFIDNSYKWNCIAYDANSASVWAVANGTIASWNLGSYVNTTTNNVNLTLWQNSSGQYPNTTGTYTSQVFDAGLNVSWGNLSWASSGDKEGWDYSGINYSTSVQSLNPYGFYWNGSNWFIIETIKKIYMYYPNWTYAGQNWSVTNDQELRDLEWNGSNWFVLGSESDIVYQFNSDFSINQRNYSIASQDTTMTGMQYVNGFWYLVGNANDAVYKYYPNLTYTGTNWSISSQEITATEIFWDGTYWWLTGTNQDSVFKYYSNWTYTGTNYSVASQDVNPSGIAFVANNWYMVGYTYKAVYKYDFNFKFQARSCDDASCSGETFVGGGNNSTSYFTLSTNTTLNTTLTSNNRWFQYKAFFLTGNTSLTPTLNNVTIGYGDVAPSVILNAPANSSINFKNATFNCTANYGTRNLTNVSLYFNANGNWNLVNTKSVSGTSAEATWNYNLYNFIGNNSLLDAGLKWNCLVYDSGGSSAWASANKTFSSWDYLGTMNLTNSSVSGNLTLARGNYQNGSGSFSTSAVGAGTPYQIILDPRDNSFWLVDNPDDAIYHLNSTGSNTTGSFLTTATGADSPISITFDLRDNSFWIIDTTDNAIYHLNSTGSNTTGSFLTTATGAGFPIGITFDSRDNSFWVTDGTDMAVYHFNSTGGNTTGSFSLSAAGSADPYGIAFDSRDNSFWVTDGTDDAVYHFNSNGVNQSDGFSTSAAGAGAPIGLIFDSRDNSFWIVDNTDDAVYHFANNYQTSGTFTSQIFDAGNNVLFRNLSWSADVPLNFRNDTDGFSIAIIDVPRGIAFDLRDNSFWIAGQGTGDIIAHFNSTGSNTTGGFGTGSAGAGSPTSVALDATDNSFWIVDNTDRFVYHFNSTGSNTTGGFSVSTVGATNPYGITFDNRDNTLWMVDFDIDFAFHFNISGSNLSDGFSSSAVGSSVPVGIAVDNSDNSFWILNYPNTIYHVNSSGGFLSSSSIASLGIADGYGITFDTTDNSLWVVDITDTFVYHLIASSLKLQARSCDDALCSGETLVGPSNTSTSYFTSSPFALNTTLTPNNRWFQYKAFFLTGNTSLTPTLNSVRVDYDVDNEVPVFSGFNSTPANGSAYVSGRSYYLNASVTSTNGSVGLTFGDCTASCTNYSVSNLSASIFNSSAISNLAAGTYQYYWWAYGNGTFRNYATSSLQYYGINKFTPTLTFLLNGGIANLSITYPQQINVSAISDFGTVGLDRNNISVLSENGLNVSLSAGNYTYRANVTGNANYSDVTYVYKQIILNQSSGIIYTYLNNLRANKTLSNASSIYLNATLINGNAAENILLYKNGTLINNGSSPVNNLTTFLIPGLYNITSIYLGNTNYTFASETYWLNVTELSAIQTTPYNNQHIRNLTPEFNGTYIGTGTGTCDLLLNSTSEIMSRSGRQTLSSGTVINITSNVTLTEGYNYKWAFYCSDSLSNVTSGNRTIQIDTINPTITWTFPAYDNSSIVNRTWNINASATDTNLYQINLTAFYPNNSVFYNNFSEDLNASAITTLNLRDLLTFNSTTPNGNYTICINATDSHTFGDIGDLSKGKKGETVLIFNTSQSPGVNISAHFTEKGGKLTDTPGTFKSDIILINNSYYKFGYNFTVIKPESVLVLNISSQNRLVYMTPYSGIRGHFIFDNKYYIDFADIPLTMNFSLVKESDYNYVIRIEGSTGWLGNEFVVIDPVVGGLNNIQECKQFLFDSTAPSALLNTPINNTNTSSLTQNFTINLTDSLSGLKNATLYIYYRNGSLFEKIEYIFIGAPTNFVLGIVRNLLPDFVFDWYYEIFDVAGNMNRTANFSITTDQTASLLSISYPLNTSYNTDISTLDYTFIELNPDRCWYSTNNGVSNSTAVVMGINFTLITSTQGANKWFVYCNDTSNNQNQANVSFMKDTIPPYFTGMSANRTAIYLNDSINEYFNASDAQIFDSFSVNDSRFIINRSGYLKNATTLGGGIYIINITINDSLNNINSSLWMLNITPTTGVIYTYLNHLRADKIISNSSLIYLNASLIIGNFAERILLYNNGTLINNGTSPVYNLTTFPIPAQYNITSIYLGNANYSFASETWLLNVSEIDNDYPLFSNFVENPSNGTIYSPNAYYQFNATIIGTNGSALLNFNGVNYSASNLSVNIFNISLRDLAAGTYNYFWIGFGNGSFNNYNNSETRSFTINKSTASTTISVNPGSLINYSTASNFSCVNANVAVKTLYLNGINKSNEIGLNIVRAAGIYIINCTGEANQNYTISSSQTTYIINKLTGAVYTYINNTRGNFSGENRTNTWLNASLNPGSGSIELKLNGNLINNLEAPVSNLTNLTAGFYNLSAVYAGNENYTASSETWWLNVLEADVIAPNFTNLENLTAIVNVSFEHDFDATDNINISCFEVNGSSFTINCSGYLKNATTLSLGMYYINVSVNDSSNNYKSGIIFVNVTQDIVAPNITLISPENGSSVSAGSINYQFNVSDLSNVSSCSLILNQVSVSTDSSITKNTAQTISYSTSAGSYNWSISCTDEYNNSANSSSRALTVTSAPAVSSTGGGGGGGGGTAESCYNWKCGEWSDCINDVQTRTCTNLGTCTGVKGKPAEMQNCIAVGKVFALFDIKIDLKNIQMVKKEALVLFIDLINVKSTGQIDVQMNYDIYYLNNTLIYSEKETRAIDQYLSFKKTIDEILLEPGQYKIAVKIFYGTNQEAYSESIFEVTPEGEVKYEGAFKFFNVTNIIIASVIIIGGSVIVLLIRIFYYLRELRIVKIRKQSKLKFDFRTRHNKKIKKKMK